ncbi:RNA polymerase sigma-70 factor, ECF subfamily [Pricia antarctica]|uniref:RNA polymerase sigma-70 factor, ECF subfamily n=1 Tax=Pricia antarctica TaxID=641691 RepID=A0A1G7EL35_9FLAO|nr:RNA polymerase sigma-70 factor [Pricia antarctica]SDE64297.1 RNA polymerase sigma-70 factor, ECF subfamily [Pricia antarctica]
MKEDTLLKGLQKGNASAYNELFSEYYVWLCNYIFTLSNDRGLSEDIVQETIIHIWEKRKRISVQHSLKNYLFRSCHNRFLAHLRKKKVRFDFLDQIRWDILAEVRIEPEVRQDSKIQKMHRLIDELPPRCREVFVKNKFEKRQYKEIAVDMGISIKTVENQMSKALQFLRENATGFML